MLEAFNGLVVQVLLPVEGGRAVVGQHLSRELFVDGFGECFGIGEIGLAGFAPDQIRPGSIGQAARNGLLDARFGAIEPFQRAFAGAEGFVIGVDIGGQQVSGFCIGACHEDRRHAQNVGCQPCCSELGNGFTGRHEYLATHVAAFLYRGELVFKVNASSACLNHGLHEFECIEHTAKTGFRIGDDGGKEVHPA